jgi:hypothetical protein
MHSVAQWMQEALSHFHNVVSLFISLCELLSVSLTFIWCKSASPKAERCPQNRVKVMVILPSQREPVMSLIKVRKWKLWIC